MWLVTSDTVPYKLMVVPGCLNCSKKSTVESLRLLLPGIARIT
jgi:hypothetical protein